VKSQFVLVNVRHCSVPLFTMLWQNINIVIMLLILCSKAKN